jgi:hypothetical protein
MSDNSYKPVDLRSQLREKKASNGQRAADRPIERIFDDSSVKEARAEQQNIRQPKNTDRQSISRQIIIFLILVIVAGGVYLWLNRQKVSKPPAAAKPIAENNQNAPLRWYAVKLANGEIYYGQISDISADPVQINNAYYNYDQIKDTKKEISEAGSIRLVKRGQETHGPTGELDVIRSQVLFLEPLADGSKVLKAILENEKK